MAYTYGLSRTAVHEWPGKVSKGVNGSFSANGTKHGRFTFDISAIRAAMGDRLIKVTGIRFGWSTSAKFTYNVYFDTDDTDSGTYAGRATGTSSTSSAAIGFTCTTAAILTELEDIINDSTAGSSVYFSVYKSGAAGGNGTCKSGSMTVYYELGAPKRTTIIDSITVDKPVALIGESITLSAQVYNTMGSAAANARVELFCLSGSTEVPVADAQNYPVNIPSLGTGIFGGTVQLYDSLALARGSRVKIRITITGGGASATQTTDLIKLIDRYYSPSIKAFMAYRCSDVTGTMAHDDSGEQIMTDLQIGLNAQSAGGFTLTVYYAENEDVDISSAQSINLDLAANFADFISGVSDDTNLITRADDFSNGSAWFFKLVLTDGIETVTEDVSISKAFANLHLAGYDSGGVSVGMYSTSTRDNPKFESAYPAFFYGDVYLYGSIHGCDYIVPYGTPTSGNPIIGEETRTPFTWSQVNSDNTITAKPIYRRVVVYYTVGDQRNNELCSFSDWNVDGFVTLRGTQLTGITVPLAYGKVYDYSIFVGNMADKKILYCATPEWNTRIIYAIIEYFKSS